MTQNGREFLQKNVDAVVKHVCESSSQYGLEIFAENNEITYLVSQNIDFPGERRVFDVYINLFFEENTLHFTVPLYEDGLVGENSGSFYQMMLEINTSINGNVKAGLYHFDDSNRPCLIHSYALDIVNEKSLLDCFSLLRDAYILAVPLLNMAVSQLRLKFDPEARSRSPVKNLLDSVQLALKPSVDDDDDNDQEKDK